MPSTRSPATRRNVIAQAHSLRGPAGSGAHGAQPRPRPVVQFCARCMDEMVVCWCPEDEWSAPC